MHTNDIFSFQKILKAFYLGAKFDFRIILLSVAPLFILSAFFSLFRKIQTRQRRGGLAVVERRQEIQTRELEVEPRPPERGLHLSA